ncbi:MAG: hypothetical protein AABW58_03910 [Nanoarchaeota archaeon]
MPFELTLIERILIYIFLLIAIYIFVKTSRIEIFGKKLINLKYRILLAVFFPIIILVAVILSSFIAALILIIILVFLIFSFLRKKKLI